MNILIIDDNPDRHLFLTKEYSDLYSGSEIDHAYSYSAAVGLLVSTRYDIVSFDHDLGEDKTGADIAKWAANHGIKFSNAFVHSSNPSGAENIISILKSGEVSLNIKRKVV